MKKVRIALLVVSLLAVIPLAASAQGPSVYTSGFQVANLDTTGTATIQITYYNPDGTVNTTYPDTVDAGLVNTYYPVHTADGFQGSVVVSSDREVASIVNILGDGGAFGGASYSAFSGGAPSSNLPLVLRNFYNINTWFSVQNAGASATSVTVTYSGSPAPTCTEQADIEPGAAAIFDQSTSSCLSDGFIGAATVTTAGGTGSIAVAAIEYDAKSLLAYSGFTSGGSQDPAIPFVSHKWYNARTAVQIQNTGSLPTDVTLTYTPSSGFPGQTCSEQQTVQPGASANFGDIGWFEDVSLPCGPMSGLNQLDYGFVGSARVTANSAGQNLVAIVNTVTSGTANGAAYGGFDSASATNRVNFPLVMDRNYGIFTGFSVANVGSQATQVDCTFSGSSRTVSQNLASGEALTDVHLNQIADGYVGTANCTATGGDELIVGIVSQLGGQGDKLLYYEGFNY